MGSIDGAGEPRSCEIEDDIRNRLENDENLPPKEQLSPNAKAKFEDFLPKAEARCDADKAAAQDAVQDIKASSMSFDVAESCRGDAGGSQSVGASQENGVSCSV